MPYGEDADGQKDPAPDFSALLVATLRRWKLVAVITLSTLAATYGAAKVLVPSMYKSTVEILVYDPQRQFDATVQKPTSLFVDAVGNDAMNTEINVLRSKSVALRVVRELGLDTDPEFQAHEFRLRNWIDRILTSDQAERFGIAGFGRRLGFLGSDGVPGDSEETSGDAAEDKAQKLDQAADTLLRRLDIWQESYIIFVSASSRDPVKAQRLASAIANDYLESQRNARQESLEHVANWLKGRVDDLQSRVLETESTIAKLKADSGPHSDELDRDREQQIGGINVQLMAARDQVNDIRARLEYARHVLDTKGGIDSIPELAASAMLSELRRKEMQLNWSAAELHSKVGEGNSQVISIKAELAAVGKQIREEEELILHSMKSAYDIAVRRQQSLEANLQALNANRNSATSVKLQELARVADADRKVHDSYLTQYNDIAERRLLQDASARVISPAVVPRSPTSSRLKLYAFGGIGGFAGSLLLAFLLEYIRGGFRTNTEIEQFSGLPVMGIIPAVRRRKLRGAFRARPQNRILDVPLAQLTDAVHTMRISIELSSDKPKAVLITSALPGEGKSTTAMLLAASCAIAGKKVILVDCDLRLRTLSETLGKKSWPGLSNVLRGFAHLNEVIVQDSVTRIYMLPAGSTASNTPDALMSREMLDLIGSLRDQFDYVIMDAPPLLQVADSLALATAADKILVVVKWNETSRTSIREAFRVLGPEVNRVAGIVLNKVNFKQLPGYGSHYDYRSTAKYLGN